MFSQTDVPLNKQMVVSPNDLIRRQNCHPKLILLTNRSPENPPPTYKEISEQTLLHLQTKIGHSYKPLTSSVTSPLRNKRRNSQFLLAGPRNGFCENKMIMLPVMSKESFNRENIHFLHLEEFIKSQQSPTLLKVF